MVDDLFVTEKRKKGKKEKSKSRECGLYYTIWKKTRLILNSTKEP